jgi:hypothetical protein
MTIRPRGPRLHVVRLELRPARPDAWPLREVKDWDVLRGFVPAFEQVNVARERLTMAVDLLPVPPRQQVPLRRKMLSSVRRRELGDSLVTIDGRSDWVNPAEVIERRVERSALGSKVGRADPFFRVQILIEAESRCLDPGRRRLVPRGSCCDAEDHAKELVERTFAAWEQFSGQNYVRAAGLPVLGTWFLGSNALWRRWWFDLRLASGYFAPARPRRVLTTRELGGFLKPWTRSCPEPTVVRQVREQLQPPEGAASTGMVVCRTLDGQPVALASRDASYHTWAVGPIGTGKSTLLANLALDRIASRLATIVIDPSKGDLIRELLARIAREHWDRVVLVDPALGRERPVGLNVLECSDPELHDLIADQVTFIFRSLFRQWWGPRTDHVMRVAVLTLLHHQGTTLCDLPALLLDDRARRRWTRGLEDPGLELFWAQYEDKTPKERQEEAGPLLYKLQSVLMRPAVRNILGQSRSTIDLGHVLDQGRVMLVALPHGELGPQTSSLLGSLLIARIWQTVQGRSARREQERPDACLMLDEFHRLLHLPQSVEEVLVESRGLHLGLVLAHQHLAQLDDASMLAAIGANAHTKVVFQCEHDSDVLASRWFHPLAARDLAELPQFQVAVRLCVGGHSASPFVGVTRPPAPDLGAEHARELVAAALRRWGRPREQVEAEILARYGFTVPPDGDDDEGDLDR